MVNNFQRAGSASNSHVGNAFEAAAREYFRQHGTTLQRNYQVPAGFSSKKPRKFDLGSGDPPVLVECKSHQGSGQGRPHKDRQVDAALWIRPCLQLWNARFGKWYPLSPPATPLLRPAG